MVGLGLDTTRMSSMSPSGFHFWPDLPQLIGWIGLGAVVGTFYFRALLRTTLWLTEAGHGAATAVLTIARLGLLVGSLVAATLVGPVPLLATALGILFAKIVIVRHVRGTRP